MNPAPPVRRMDRRLRTPIFVGNDSLYESETL
jgi:phosphoribosylformylglycinamidine (FGAM) synthase-like enzyme